MVLVTCLYMLATQAPQRTPVVIEPGTIDALVPFIPAAAYVYVTYALLLPVLIVIAAHRGHFSSVLAVGMGCGLSNAAIYNLIPTRIAQRTLAPAGSLLESIQRLDTTLGAVPSGHVALPAAVATAAFLVALSGARDATRNGSSSGATFWLRAAAGYALWTVALAGSALLTGQHYVLDIAAGLVFGPAFAALGVWTLRGTMDGVQCGR